MTMHNIERNLFELLYEYDCVTIPSFGGIIMQSAPAALNRSGNRISPPSRIPAFNSLLVHDDGLLISSIARDRKVSYREAAIIAGEFAASLKKRIYSGDKATLAGVGEFMAGEGEAIVFKPAPSSNFDPSAYGMQPVDLGIMTRKPAASRLGRKPEDRKTEGSKRKQPASVRWTMILSLPVIFFLLYGILFPVNFQKIYTSYSGLNPGIRHTEKISRLLPVPSPAITAEPAENPTPEPRAIKISQPASPRYYIIGGCFVSEENAVEFINKLTTEGFDPERAGTNNRGQVRVSYKSFADRASALAYLQKIRNEENSDAWLLKY